MFSKRKVVIAVAIGLAATVGAVVPSGASQSFGSGRVTITANAGALADLAPAVGSPTDGAKAAALAVGREGKGTIVVLAIKGLDTAAEGTKYGAHVHVGPCEAGNGAAAGAHYNSKNGAVINETTEVWLDFTVRSNGTAGAYAKVPFVIPPGGAKSVVIHAMATMPDGTAGARLACLPLEF